jgi:hypothetical protein
VIERLIANEAFNQLSLASPFRVGYQYHDEALVQATIGGVVHHMAHSFGKTAFKRLFSARSPSYLD